MTESSYYCPRVCPSLPERVSESGFFRHSDLVLETENKDLALLPEEVSKSFQQPPFLNLPTKICQIQSNTDWPPDKAKAVNTSLL